MQLLRKFSAAISIAAAVLCLAGCGNSGNGTTQAANPGPNAYASPSANPNANVNPTQPRGILSKLSDLASRTVTIPEGTPLSVRLDNSVSSARNRSGDTFHATLVRPIDLNGGHVVPQGTRLTGTVLEARSSGHLQTPAALSIAFTSMEVGGKSYEIRTSSYSRIGQSHKKHDLMWIGGGAGGGALLGALIGHRKGAAIGMLAGAGGGTAAAYATGRQDIVLPSEAPVHVVLRRSVTIIKSSTQARNSSAG